MLAQVDPADGPARSHADGVAGGALAAREYRIGELAREAGITVRTLRYYRERRLLPPPRREGRIGWYSQAHLDRLRVIGQLVDRGHVVRGSADDISARYLGVAGEVAVSELGALRLAGRAGVYKITAVPPVSRSATA